MTKKGNNKSGHRTDLSSCQCLEFKNGQAREVFVAGSFNDWNPTATAMVALGKGRWVKELALPPGRYEYRFVVDGQWIDDPNAKESVPNPFGSVNAILIVDGPSKS